MFHTGLHKEYHKPEDDPETIDIEGLVRIAHPVIHHLGTSNHKFRAVSYRKNAEER